MEIAAGAEAFFLTYEAGAEGRRSDVPRLLREGHTVPISTIRRIQQIQLVIEFVPIWRTGRPSLDSLARSGFMT